MDYGEAPLMDQVRRLENHESIYKADINEEPYTISNYPPVYAILVAAINVGVKIPLFQSGRFVSIIFSLVCGLIIGVIGFHLTGRKLYGLVGAIIFLGNPYVLLWSSLARVDMTALAFCLLGILVLFRSKGTTIWIFGAALLMVISVYARQSYLLAGPLAGFVWLWQKNKRQAVIFVSVIGISGLLIFGMINALTHNGFYTNIVVANINNYEISRTLTMFKQLFILWPIILPASFGLGIFLIKNKFQAKDIFIFGDQKQNLRFVYSLIFFTLGAFISALTVGKVGSDVNYFLELISACAIWSVIGIKFFFNQKRALQFLSLGLATIQLIWVLIAGYTLSNTIISTMGNKLAYYNDLFNQVQKATQAGIVLSDDYLDMVVLSGQSIYYQPFEYGQLYQAHLWNPTTFAEEINQKSFPLILIGGNTLDKPCCWPPPLVDAIQNNYQMVAESQLLLFTPMK